MPCTVVMYGEISYEDQSYKCFDPGCKRMNFWCKLEILIRGWVGIDSLWETDSSGHLRHCIFLALLHWLRFSVPWLPLLKSTQTKLLNRKKHQRTQLQKTHGEILQSSTENNSATLHWQTNCALANYRLWQIKTDCVKDLGLKFSECYCCQNRTQ